MIVDVNEWRALDEIVADTSKTDAERLSAMYRLSNLIDGRKWLDINMDHLYEYLDRTRGTIDGGGT